VKRQPNRKERLQWRAFVHDDGIASPRLTSAFHPLQTLVHPHVLLEMPEHAKPESTKRGRRGDPSPVLQPGSK
jgi:hypothetical protein